VVVYKFQNSGKFLNHKMGDQLKHRGTLVGHGGWVTAIATTPEDPNLVLTASRDKVTFLNFNLKNIILFANNNQIF
jgi:hypothetical protein